MFIFGFTIVDTGFARSPAVEPLVEIVPSSPPIKVDPRSKDLGYNFGNYQIEAWSNQPLLDAHSTQAAFGLSTLFFLTLIMGIIFGTFGFIFAKDDSNETLSFNFDIQENVPSAEVISLDLHREKKENSEQTRKAS